MCTTITEYSDSFTMAAIIDILDDINSDYSGIIRQNLKLGLFRNALEVAPPNPSDYTSAHAFAGDYLAYNLLRKSEFLDLGIDKKAAAVTSLLESEASCKLINTYGSNPYVFDRGITTTSLEAKIFLARDLIKRLLGPFSWNDASEHFCFSDGASTRLPRKSGAPFYKFQGQPEVTPGAADLAILDIARTPLWKRYFEDRCEHPRSWVRRVLGSRADTVPKTWKTDRFICIEPDLNMRIQRGIGTTIRRKLRRVGVNLDDQTLNQRLARIGSSTGSLATIDLKSASDSISLRLVEELLPGDWYEAIFLARSHYTILDGVAIKLEKVSSMGNGFTFELESLIFWALSKSVLTTHATEDQRLAIYGDDIVIHASVAEPLIELLSYCGFETNKDKTFVKGPFRESCGKHYFYGVDVSPFNVKSKIESEDRFYWLMNSYNEWIRRMGHSYPKGAKRIFRRGRKFASRFCIVPPGYGYDSGIETPISRAKVIWSLRSQRYVFKALRAVRKIHEPNGSPALLHWLSVAGSHVSQDVLVLYKGDAIYQRFNVGISQWDD